LRKKLLNITLLAVFSCCQFFGQPCFAFLKKDSTVVQGKLANGLKYYIKEQNTNPNKASLQLVVRAGSVHELEGEEGLAYFVNHLNLKSNKYFSSQEVQKILGELGLSGSADSVAHTYYDKTTYDLDVAVDHETHLDKALFLLRSWAGEARILSDEVEAERGILHHAWLLHNGRKNKWVDRVLPVLLEGSKYADHFLYGKEDVLTSCSGEDLKSFYNRRYLPDLMAIVVVGDVDALEIEEKLVSIFSTIPETSSSISSNFSEMPYYEKIRTKVFSDSDMTTSLISLMFKHPANVIREEKDVERKVAYSIIRMMLEQRLYHLTDKELSSFLNLNCLLYPYTQPMEVFEIEAQCLEEDILSGTKDVLAELKRLCDYGFTRSEIERAKNDYLYQLKNEDDYEIKVNSKRLIRKYAEHFINESEVIDPRIFREVTVNSIKSLTRLQINDYVNELFNHDQYVVSLFVPDRSNSPVCTEQDIENILSQVKQQALPPWQDEIDGRNLDLEFSEKGKIVGEQVFNELGVVEWTLSNGMKVCLKPTSLQKNEIVVHGIAKGGVSGFKGEEQVAGKIAEYIGNKAGIGGFTPLQLEQLSKGKNISLKTKIGANLRQLTGECDQKSFETQMQLLYLLFTDFNCSSEFYDSLLNKYKDEYLNKKDPVFQFAQEVLLTNSKGCGHLKSLTDKELERITQVDVENVYKRCFSSPEEFTVFFVGDFSIEEAEEYVVKYLASIPIKKENSSLLNEVNCGVVFPKGVTQKEINQGFFGEARVQLSLPLEHINNRFALKEAELVCSLIESRLQRVLFNKKLDAYSIKARTNYPFLPDMSSAFISIVFDCSLEAKPEIVDLIFSQILDLQSLGPTQEELISLKHRRVNQAAKLSMGNAYWVKNLIESYLWNEFSSDAELDKYIDRIIEDGKSSRDLVQRWLAPQNYSLVTLH
jgi:zinc protease